MLDVMRLDRDISELNREIAECERYEMLPLSSLFDEDTAVDSGLIDAILEGHLAADYLVDCIYAITDIVEQYAKNKVNLPVLDTLRHSLDEFNKALLRIDSRRFTEMLTDNETLIAALRKKSLSYITNRMAHAKAN